MKVAHLGSPRLSHLTVFAGLLTLCPVAIATVDISLRLATSWGHNSNLFRNDIQTGLGGNDSPTQQVLTPTATSVQTHGAHVSMALPLGSPETRLVLSTSLNAQRFGAANPWTTRHAQMHCNCPGDTRHFGTGNFQQAMAQPRSPWMTFILSSTSLTGVGLRYRSLEAHADIQIPLRSRLQQPGTLTDTHGQLTKS